MNPQQLKAMGRGSDNTVAHLTPGEVVLPHEVAQRLKGKIESIIGRDQMERLTVGRGTASTNPSTGLEEFSWLSKQYKSAKKRVGGFLGDAWADVTGKSLRTKMEQGARDSEARIKKQYKQQAEKMQKMFNLAIAKQSEAYDKQKAETAFLLQEQKIETIKTRRKYTKEKRGKVAGATYGSAEITSAANPLESAGPRYTPRSSRRKASFGARSMPTLQIGGQSRPS